MIDSYREALTEVDEILKYLPNEDIKKIPIKLKKFIEEKKSPNYVFNIDENIPLEEQKLKKETKSFMAMLLLKYLDKDNAPQLLKQYNENEKLIAQKYSADVFKNKKMMLERDNSLFVFIDDRHVACLKDS